MGVYRSDQAQLTFAAEAAQGGDPELMQGTSGSSGTTLSAGVNAGSRTITVASASGFTVGDFIRIGTVEGTYASTITAHEVRRLEAINGTTFTLDRPTAFYHAASDDGTATEVQEVSAVGNESILEGDNGKYITFIPGIYDSIDTPDPEMSIEGRHFLSTQSKRNFSVAYSGTQTLVGAVSGIVLLNGWPLRFPIGSVRSFPIASSTSGSTGLTLNGAVKKGDMYILLNAVTGLVDNDYIVIGYTGDDSNSTAEVRRIVDIISSRVKLNYPLQFDHATSTAVRECTTASVYTHTIAEAADLDTVTWHVHMKDSTETDDKDFDRRYVGGMIGSSTISAEEGGLVSMSWDSVNFLNMVHNQRNQETVAASSNDLYYGASPTANMPRFSLMQTIDNDDIGIPSHNGAAVNDGTGYPNTQPYYFSEGTIKFFGKEFARIRSFSLGISNGEEPRYYIGKQGARARGPYEIKEGARDYSMSATVALPDADIANDAAVGVTGQQEGALELFKQLLLEGDYGHNEYKSGFTATIKFERGTNDYIIIDIPGSATGSAGTPTTTTSQVNKQGVFINSATHSITGDNIFQVDLDMIFRALKITIVDGVPVYP